MNVVNRFQHKTDAQPEETAIVGAQGTELTYREVDERSRQIAAWLDEHGIGPGDRVAVYLPDTTSYVPAMLGCWRTGAVASPTNTRFGLDELEYTFSDLGPDVLLGSDMLGNKIDDVTERLENLDEEDTVLLEKNNEFSSEEFPAPEHAPEPARRLDEDPAVIMYTSGTTGNPKGVVQTHRNVDAQLDVNVTRYNLHGDDVTLVSVPLFHVGGLYAGALSTMLAGGTTLLQLAWDAESWAQRVEEYDATMTGLIPTMMIDLLNTPSARERDTSSLELVFYGGSPAAEETLAQFEEVFEVDQLSNYYGQTENTGLSVTYGPETERRPGLAGRPVAAVEHRIVELDADGLVDVEPGEEGELLLRGDIITPGYLQDSLTKRNFTDEWLHTGDVFRADEDGLLYYLDRVDDMILSGGENVAPTEVEGALQEHPAIADVAVFGTSHERLGEAVTAAIRAGDEEVTANDIEQWWRDSVDLAGYKRPRQIEFVEQFPRTATQKIDKVALKDQLS